MRRRSKYHLPRPDVHQVEPETHLALAVLRQVVTDARGRWSPSGSRVRMEAQIFLRDRAAVGLWAELLGMDPDRLQRRLIEAAGLAEEGA